MGLTGMAIQQTKASTLSGPATEMFGLQTTETCPCEDLCGSSSEGMYHSCFLLFVICLAFLFVLFLPSFFVLKMTDFKRGIIKQMTHTKHKFTVATAVNVSRLIYIWFGHI